ncbi:MAG: OmpH family outer membrane protein, partial [candidate division Zixibacteria bacterium]|nr:OmpH family outer membrane protein [candidate division Zixibacteria bacterium]
MRIVSKILIASAAIAIILTAFPSGAQAQGFKVGYVNDELIKQGYKAWQRAEEQWNIEQKAWDDEALAKQTELQELIDEYEKQKLILSDEKKSEREAAINTKKEALDAFTRQVYGPGGTAERKQRQIIEPLLDNVTKAIETVAIENDYD